MERDREREREWRLAASCEMIRFFRDEKGRVFLIFLSLGDLSSFEDESFAAGFELGSRLYFVGCEIRGGECKGVRCFRRIFAVFSLGRKFFQDEHLIFLCDSLDDIFLAIIFPRRSFELFENSILTIHSRDI